MIGQRLLHRSLSLSSADEMLTGVSKILAS